MKKLTAPLSLILLPSLALANSPGVMTLTLELGFMAIVIIALLKVEFSLEKKAIVFGAYICLGVLTKSIWLPVLCTSVLFFIFFKTHKD